MICANIEAARRERLWLSPLGVATAASSLSSSDSDLTSAGGIDFGDTSSPPSPCVMRVRVRIGIGFGSGIGLGLGSGIGLGLGLGLGLGFRKGD